MVSINIVLVVISFVVFQLSTAWTITPIWLSPLNTTNVGPDLEAPRGEWANITVGVGSRSGNFVVQVDSKGKIWILGGYSSKFYANAVWNYDPKTDLYRWVAGQADTSDELLPNYTEFGVPDENAIPGFITVGAYAIDRYDNIWIYGGEEHQNMFWRFNTTSFEFTNFRVNDTILPVVGEVGVPSADNYPGSREGASLLVDSHNNLWLLGGYREYNINGRWYSDFNNEVWHFNTTSFQWTFASGQLSTEVDLDYKNKTWNGRYLAAAIIDSEDRIWIFGGTFYESSYGDMWSFDTKTLTWRVEWGNETSLETTGSLAVLDDFDINNFPSARAGAGMVDRQDGTLLVGGGFIPNVVLTNDYWLFNKTSKLWKFVHGSLNHTSGALVANEFTHYRSPGSVLGSRWNSGISGGIHNRGNFLLCGGEGNTIIGGDIWIFPQDQCVGANNDCDVNAACTVSSDDYFSRTCTCNEGYIGDGKTCTLSPVSSPSDSSNNPSSNVTPNNNGTPSKSPSSKVSEAGVITSCSLFVHVAILLLSLF